MKKLLVLAVLAYGGWYGYQQYIHWKGTPATMAFKDFATAVVKGDTPAMEALIGDSSAKPIAFENLQFSQQFIDHVFIIYYTIKSENIDETGGTAEIRVSQNLRFDPVGIHSGTGAKVIESTFHGWMIKDMAGAWKVKYFDTDLQKIFSESLK